MAFEIFTETGTRSKEFISVTETKSFGLSRAFLDKYDVTADKKAVILYDPESNQVALHFTDNDPKFAFSIRTSNEKHGATIMAKSFFELKGLDVKRYAGRYSDFYKKSLAELGINDKAGYAFVFALKEREPAPEAEEPDFQHRTPNDDVVIDDIDDEPINLDEIPF
jgi:hypothetical protein